MNVTFSMFSLLFIRLVVFGLKLQFFYEIMLTWAKMMTKTATERYYSCTSPPAKNVRCRTFYVQCIGYGTIAMSIYSVYNCTDYVPAMPCASYIPI